MSVYCVAFLRFYIYVQVRYMRVGHLAVVLGPGMHWAAFFSSAQGGSGQSWKFSGLGQPFFPGPGRGAHPC